MLIFDLWQTLADIPVHPSDYIVGLLHLNQREKGILNRRLQKSIMFSSLIPLRDGLEDLLSPWSPDETNIALAEKYWEGATQSAVLFPQILKTLQSLKSAGYRLALLTNIDAYGLQHFRFPELLTLFSVSHFSCVEGVAKPSPTAWNRLLRKVAVSPRSAIMIGDSLTEDIIPSRALGLYTILISSHLSVKADLTLRSSAELTPEILNILLDKTQSFA